MIETAIKRYGRNDNRLENLELWVKTQPSGQRVEDLVDFVAKEYPELVTAEIVALKNNSL